MIVSFVTAMQIWIFILHTNTHDTGVEMAQSRNYPFAYRAVFAIKTLLTNRTAKFF